MKIIPRAILAAAMAAVIMSAACRSKGAETTGGEEPRPAAAAGPASVTLTAEAIAAADLKTAPAATRTVARRISAAGEIGWNARRVVHLTARTPGRLERVFVAQGDRVREGQLLAEIYSPDYLTLQAEYLQAAARAKRLAGNPAEEGPARAVLAGARERLALLGVVKEEIDAIGGSGLPNPLLHVHAPLGGTVLQCDVVAGDAVELGTSLFRLVDPSTLWAGLHIQEKDLAAVKTGDEVLLRTQAYPGE